MGMDDYGNECDGLRAEVARLTGELERAQGAIAGTLRAQFRGAQQIDDEVASLRAEVARLAGELADRERKLSEVRRVRNEEVAANAVMRANYDQLMANFNAHLNALGEARADVSRLIEEAAGMRGIRGVLELTVKNYGAEIDNLRAQVPPAEVVAALRAMCELGTHPTTAWFEAQKIVVAWLSSQPQGEQ